MQSRCEWQEINCPILFAGDFWQCQIKSRAQFLKLQSAGVPEGSEEYGAIESQLSDLSQLRCPLENALHPTLEMGDFTDEQLALVGATRYNPDLQVKIAHKRGYPNAKSEKLDAQVLELVTQETDLTNVVRCEILGISEGTFYRSLKRLRRTGQVDYDTRWQFRLLNNK